MQRIWTLAGLAACIWLGSINASFAQFILCNQSAEQTVNVAIAYEAEPNEWVSKGWFEVRQGQCETLIPGELGNRYYYLYAEGGDSVWEAAEGDDDGREFCIQEDRAFTLYRGQHVGPDDALQCEQHGLAGRDFLEMDTEDSAEFTYTLER